MLKKYTFAALALGCLIAANAQAATIVGPSPYLALADAPAEFTNAGGGMPFMAQDFEDPNGPWEMGFSINVGQRIGPKFTSGDGVPVTDSVDADDSAIDGDGTMGSSWFVPTRQLTITFDQPAKAAGFVFTDTDPNAQNITVTAYDEAGVELVSQTYDASFMDDVFTGTTQEDRFFGVVPMNAGEAIKSINVSIDTGSGIEIDHVQFFKQVPEPAAGLMLLTSLIGLTSLRRRRS